MEKKFFSCPRLLSRTRPWWCFPLFILFFLSFDSLAQTASRTGSGTVTDLKGNPLVRFQIVLKDANGDPIIDPVTKVVKTRPATAWTDYDKATLKNLFRQRFRSYFLYPVQVEYNVSRYS